MMDKVLVSTDYWFELGLPLWADNVYRPIEKTWCDTNGHTPEQWKDKVVYCESCGKTLELLK